MSASPWLHEPSVTREFVRRDRDRRVRENRARAARPRSGTLAWLTPLTLGLDLTLIAAALGFAYLGRGWVIFGEPTTVAVAYQAPVLAPILIVTTWLASIVVAGGYAVSVFGVGTEEFKKVLLGSVFAAAITSGLAYLFALPLPRGLFVLAFALGGPLLLCGRWALRRVVHRARRTGWLQQRVLVVGTLNHVDEVGAVLARERWLGYDVIGVLTFSNSATAETELGLPVLGEPEGIAAEARRFDVDVVMLAGGAVGSSTHVRRLAWDLQDEHVQVMIVPSLTDVSAERVSVRPVAGLPMIHLEKPRTAGALRRAKRAFDLVAAVSLLVVFSPMFVAAAIAVKLHDGGPVFFRQARVGVHAHPFPLWKFRTMVPDAEAGLAVLHQETGYSGGLFKMKDDPRITRPGKWLRRYSIDELPQLVNVVLGDMSLVGPRPPLEREVSQYDADVAQRLRVRPGMTGLWQVSGRSRLSWAEAVRLDLYYVDNWSMLQDLSILFRTFSAVMRSRGAY